jgi:hypothetical protein
MPVHCNELVCARISASSAVARQPGCQTGSSCHLGPSPRLHEKCSTSSLGQLRAVKPSPGGECLVVHPKNPLEGPLRAAKPSPRESQRVPQPIPSPSPGPPQAHLQGT